MSSLFHHTLKRSFFVTSKAFAITQDHLWNLSEELLRSATESSSDKKKMYKCFQIQEVKELKVPKMCREEKRELIRDWNDIHGVSRDFGSPEFADHMSGHIFMQGTPVEDKSSKCVRIGDQLDLFDHDELHQCIQCTLSWKDSLKDSAILQGLIKSIDSQCEKRLFQVPEAQCLSLIFTIAQLKPFQSLTSPLTLWQSLRSQGQTFFKSEEAIVVFLFLTSLCSNEIAPTLQLSKALEERLVSNFDLLSQAELAICHSGLEVLSGGEKKNVLSTLITSRFGFRL